ncbi:MAG: hypothetical protein FJ387_12385 [Verrucomicrobia bacterium]|nr:hypothetical protein [Verrucomicrobiota bacterium]
MKRCLHILTQPEDPLAHDLIRQQQPLHKVEVEVEVFDLTLPQPDYHDLVRRICAASSIVVW